MQTVAVAVGLPQQPSFVSVSTCELRHVLLAVPRRFHRRVHSPTSSIALFRVDSASFLPSATTGPIDDLGLRSAHRWQQQAPHGGSAFPLRGLSLWCPLIARSTQLHATFRPRRSTRPRRLAPPHALWVCFAPQPRTGFSLQGFCHIAEPYRVFPGRCPPAVFPRVPAFPKMAPAR